jgi:xylulokinase
MDVAIASILLLGGGARSRIWAQIRADLTGFPVAVPKIVDTSPMGAALLASIAAGLQPDLVRAAGLVDGAAQTVDPDPSLKAIYDDTHAAYRKLFESLRPMFEPRADRLGRPGG